MSIFSISGYVLDQVLAFLRGPDLVRLALTCQEFAPLLNDDELWDQMNAQDFGGLPGLPSSSPLGGRIAYIANARMYRLHEVKWKYPILGEGSEPPHTGAGGALRRGSKDGPCPREGSAAASLGHHFIVFGGWAQGFPTLRGDVWSLDTASRKPVWRQHVPARSGVCPGPRYGHALTMAWVPEGALGVPLAIREDERSEEEVRWAPVRTRTPPESRTSSRGVRPGALVEPILIVTGGMLGGGYSSPTGPVAVLRGWHEFGEEGDAELFLGWERPDIVLVDDEGNPLESTDDDEQQQNPENRPKLEPRAGWGLDGPSFETEIDPSVLDLGRHGPLTPRGYHTATFSPKNGKVYVFGGIAGQESIADLEEIDPVTWTLRRPLTTGRPPRARHGHAAVCVDGRLWILGGGNGGDILRDGVDFPDIVSLDLATMAWSHPRRVGLGGHPTEVARLPAWMGRCLTAAAIGRNIVVFGGGRKPSNHTAIINLDPLNPGPLGNQHSWNEEQDILRQGEEQDILREGGEEEEEQPPKKDILREGEEEEEEQPPKKDTLREGEEEEEEQPPKKDILREGEEEEEEEEQPPKKDTEPPENDALVPIEDDSDDEDLLGEFPPTSLRDEDAEVTDESLVIEVRRTSVLGAIPRARMSQISAVVGRSLWIFGGWDGKPGPGRHHWMGDLHRLDLCRPNPEKHASRQHAALGFPGPPEKNMAAKFFADEDSSDEEAEEKARALVQEAEAEASRSERYEAGQVIPPSLLAFAEAIAEQAGVTMRQALFLLLSGALQPIQNDDDDDDDDEEDEDQ